MMNLRIGQGYDIHKFSAGKPLIIGGVHFPDVPGFIGHSDGDVLIHAIIDSILGALCLGDIGQWFPDTSPKYKDANSGELLKTVLASPELQGWKIVNLDTTLITQRPKLSPYYGEIRLSLAKLLNTDVERISVKAKTNEHLDSIGQGEAAAAQAVVLLQKD